MPETGTAHHKPTGRLRRFVRSPFLADVRGLAVILLALVLFRALLLAAAAVGLLP